MAPIVVTTASTTVVAPNAATRYIHLQNKAAAEIFVSYDGTDVTLANGIGIAAGASLQLSGEAQCSRGVKAIIAAATGDLRVISA
jgi:hypothetical protein